MVGLLYTAIYCYIDKLSYCARYNVVWTITPHFTHKPLQYTISGKKVEVAVKKIISGESVNQRGALANPNSLDLYYDIPELKLS